MNQFRTDNTEGFTAAELAQMNREFDAAMAGVDRDGVNYADIIKATAERILRAHGAA